MIDEAGKLGANLEHVQELNRSLVIRLLQQRQPCSRADLAAWTGLKQSTMTHIVNDFIQWGLVRETGIIDGKKGRRSIGLAMNGAAFRVVGVRLARSAVTAGLFDLDGTAHRIERQLFDLMRGGAEAIALLKSMIRRLLDSAEAQPVAGVGLAVPGPLFRGGGKVSLMTDFLGWQPRELQEELQAEFGLPVCLEHDAKAGALAEWWLGANRSFRGSMVYVLVSEGVGAAFIVDGKLYRGHQGIAGELGHMSLAFDGPACACGSRGCLETYVSVPALVEEARRLAKESSPDEAAGLSADCSYPDVLAAVQRQDPVALQALERIARPLGFALVNIANLLNPQRIVIGDDLAAAGEPLLAAVRRTLQAHALPGVYPQLSVELSAFPKEPILAGASALIIDRLLNHPSLFQRGKGGSAP